MVDYLKKRYKLNKTAYNIFIDINKVITIPILFAGRSVSKLDNNNVFIRYYSYDNSVTISHDIDHITELHDKLCSNYVVSEELDNTKMTNCYRISPKDNKESSNSFLLEVIDFILNNTPDGIKRRIIKESVWNDIRKRGVGADVKKEDDVNLLDRDGFYEYLINHYNTYENSSDIYTIRNSEAADTINIPFIETYDNKIYRVIMWNFDKDKMISSRPYITIPYRLGIFDGGKLFRKMSKEYILKELMDDRFNPRYEILPKGIVKKTEINNKFFLGVIDFIIDNIEDKNFLLINKK